MTEIKPVQCLTAPADFDGAGVFVGGGWHHVEGGVLRLPRGEYDSLRALGFTDTPEATAPTGAQNVAGAGFTDATADPA